MTINFIETATSASERHLLTLFDVIYVDAGTWMSTEMERFLQQAAPALSSTGKRLTMTAGVYKKLTKCANFKYAAQIALKIKEQYAQYIHVEAPADENISAESEFVRLLFFNHRKCRQLLITHDWQLATDVQNCCRHGEADEMSTVVMTLWPDGNLITFAEMARRKERQARVRMEEMIAGSPVYMDSTVLECDKLHNFLQNITPPMQALDKKVRMLSCSLNAGQQKALARYSDVLEVIPVDARMSESDALLGELYLSPSHLETKHLILVTQDVALANELRARRPKCEGFPFVDFLTINKYGFLSYLKLSDAPPQQPERKPRPVVVRKPMVNTRPQQQERKPSAYVPQLIGAIKNDDVEAMCAYIAKGANLRNGIITALCQSKDTCLRVMLEKSTGKIDPTAFEWWVTEYYSFAEPQYLAENPEHYELMQMLIAKSSPMQGLQKAMMTLAERVSEPDSAHEQLWQLIRMALRNGAPAAVYSQETGETLPEIARRQGNSDMLAFLQAR